MDNGQKLIKKPIYKGGKAAMSKFIMDNIEYPEKAKKEKIEGVVSVRIDIDVNGKVKKAVVKKKLGYGCDEEAARVASLLEFYVDSKRKVRMTFHRTINVHFRLPKKKTATPPKPRTPKVRPSQTASATTKGLQVVYTFVPAKKK